MGLPTASPGYLFAEANACRKGDRSRKVTSSAWLANSVASLSGRKAAAKCAETKPQKVFGQPFTNASVLHSLVCSGQRPAVPRLRSCVCLQSMPCSLAVVRYVSNTFERRWHCGTTHLPPLATSSAMQLAILWLTESVKHCTVL